VKVARLRPRLALWIYLAGLLQIGVVLVGFLGLARVRASAGAARELEARAAIEVVVAELGDDAAVRRELDRVERELDASITIHDETGHVIVTSRRAGEPMPPRPPPGSMPRHFPAGPPPWAPPGMHGPRPAFVMPVRLPSGAEGRAVFALRSPPAPARDAPWVVAIVLVGVGIVSLLLAQALARPLGDLARAARAFGAGKLDARARLSRRDEIGEVAAAFDEMADRVTTLLRAEKELIANVSHELRTPLSRIRVALDLAEEGDSATAREALSDIAVDLAELERLIGDVLTAARLDLADGSNRGIPPLRRERLEMAGLVELAAARFRSAHPDRPLRVTIGHELPAVEGDPVLLRRVVDNLLENAHKYSPRGEDEVELSAARDDGGVRVEVRDHGIGVAAEDLPHVFRPFFRADRSRTRATGGLGLGLALARRIVDAHAGTIALESRLGEGTRAVVRLPASAGDRQSGAPPSPSPLT
jgi:signal transduction histidine kinase